MKESTRQVLTRAYEQLQRIAADLYEATDNAMQNGDYQDASLLQARADKIYEEAENLDLVISEMGEQ